MGRACHQIQAAWEHLPPAGYQQLNDELGASLVWHGQKWDRSLVTGEASLPLDGPGRAHELPGQVVRFGAATYQAVRLAFNSNTAFSSFTRCTVAMLVRTRDTTHRTAAYLGAASFDSAGRVQIETTLDGTLMWDWGGSSQTNGGGRLSVAYTKQDAAWEARVFVVSPDRGMEIWRDGVLLASDVNRAATSDNRNISLYLGSAFDLNVVTDSFDCALVVIAGGVAWAPELIRGWCEQPIGTTFVPEQIWLPKSSGGGSTYTMSAPTYVPGSITSTGLTARVTVTAA